MPTVIVAVLGLVIALLSSRFIYILEFDSYKSTFNETAHSISAAIIKKMIGKVSVPHALKAFYSSSNHVEQSEFDSFAKTILADRYGISSLQLLTKKPRFNTLDYSKSYIYAGNKEHEVFLRIKDTDIARMIDYAAEHQYKSFVLNDYGKNTDSYTEKILATPVLKTKNNSNEIESFVITVLDLQKIIKPILHEFVDGLNIDIFQIESEKLVPIYSSVDHTIYDPDKADEWEDKVFLDYFIWGERKFMVAITISDEYPHQLNLFPPYIVFLAILLLTVFILAYIWDSAIKTIAIEKAVEERTLDLRRSNEELDRFAYIVSHDLKEPIRGIRNYAAFLVEDYAEKLDEDGIELLDDISMLADKMSNLMSSLLEYSRVGRTEFAYQATDLSVIVDDVIFSLKNLIEEQEVEIIKPKKFPVVYCDKIRIGEVFLNLITNAIKYNNKEKKIVEISFFEDPQKGFVFFVRDNGKGMDEQHYKVIFEIFKRLDHNSNDGGTGVGLTVVKKIIERHEGEIWVESKIGEGSKFLFTLRGKK